MLVVIAIIAILAGLLFPGVTAALNSGKRTKARTAAQSIEGAIVLYSSDYGGKLPTADGYGTDKFYTEDESQDIIKVLMAIDEEPNANHVLNPKRKVYLDSDQNVTDGTFEDPWGTQYGIWLDLDYDGKVEYLNASGEAHRKKAVVVSAGEDEDMDETDDNIANVDLDN